MNQYEKNLIIIYTIITIILTIIEYIILCWPQKSKKCNSDTIKALLPVIFLITIILPIIIFAIWSVNFLSYGIAHSIFKDDFVTTQIVANWVNIFIFCLDIKCLKERKNSKKLKISSK